MAMLSPQEWLAQKRQQDLPADMMLSTAPVLPQQEQPAPIRQPIQQQPLPVDMQIQQPAVLPQQERQGNVLSPQEWLAQKKVQSGPSLGDKALEAGAQILRGTMKPAETALEVISWFDKPRGAIVGGVQALQNNTDIVAGAKQGWKENTSWKETFPEDFKRNDPYYLASIGGLAADIAGDPLWLLPPAKIVQGIVKGSKALGITDNVAPVVNKAINSDIGQKAIDFVSDKLAINRPTESAQAVFNATKAGFGGMNKDALKQVENIVTEYLPNANRQQVEAIMERMVTSYPDIGTFARKADKVEGRDVIIQALQKDLETASTGLKTAKDAVSKVGALSDEEKAIADILQSNKLKPDSLQDAIKTAQGMGEVMPTAKPAARGIEELGKIKKEAANRIRKGQITEAELTKVRALFSEGEWELLMPDIAKKFKNSSALADVERMGKTTTATINPASALEGNVLDGIGKAAKTTEEALPTGTRTPFKWEDVLKRGNEGRLTPDEINSVKGILTPEEAQTFIDKAVSRDRNRQAIFEGATKGTLTPSDVLKFQDLFNSQELRQIGEQLSQRYDKYAMGVSKNENVRKLIYGIKEAAERKAVEEAKVSDALAKGLNANIDKPLKDVNINGLNNVVSREKVTADIPNLYSGNTAKLDGQGVLPKVDIQSKPQTAVNLSNVTEDQRRLLAGVKNVPELAEKIKTAKAFEEQSAAVERLRTKLDEIDISPEKLTQVIDSALKQGYAPKEVEGMFKASEIMRQVNQTMTDEALSRALIPASAAGDFSSGRHLRRMYAAIERPEDHYNNLVKAGYKEQADKFWEAFSKFEGGLKSQGISINTATFESRKQLPKALQEQLGRIYEATYPFAKGNKMAIEQYAKYDFLKEISKKFSSDTMQPGYRKVPITADGKYGQLEGKFLPARAYQETMYSVGKFDQQANTWQKWVQRWKAAKLINPASINRNTMSGAVMANVFGGIPVQNMPKIISETWADLRHGTENFLRARNNGLFEATISKAELDALENRIRGVKPGSMDKLDSLFEKGMKYFSMPDEFWRMAVYNYHVGQGLPSMEAVKKANRALFDYSNAPAWLETLTRNGIVPFGKFPFFATMATAEALYKNPAKVTKFTKAQNQVNTEDREKIMPDYLKAKTLLPIGEGTRIVNGKPQKVQQNIDLSYILPFASDVSVGNPLVDALQLYRTGKNSIGQEIIKQGMTTEDKAKEWTKFTANALAPTLISPYNTEKLINAAQGNVDSKGRQYDLPDAVLQVLGGIRNVPINTDETYKQKINSIRNEMNRTTALRNQLANNESLTREQKLAKKDEYNRQLKELYQQGIEASKAHKRIKAKGAN
jgi:hypothetical protein